MRSIIAGAAAMGAVGVALAVAPAAWAAGGPPGWIGSGSAAPDPVPAPPTVTMGDYCRAQSAPTLATDGRTAYCSRVQFTDAHVWSPTPDLVATDPHFPVDPGDACLDPDAVTTGTGGRTMYCNPTQNGRQRGNLVWQLLP